MTLIYIDFDYLQIFQFGLMNYKLKNLELIIVKHQGRVVQSPIKLTQDWRKILI